jgi:hypothetical protein
VLSCDNRGIPHQKIFQLSDFFTIRERDKAFRNIPAVILDCGFNASERPTRCLLHKPEFQLRYAGEQTDCTLRVLYARDLNKKLLRYLPGISVPIETILSGL